MARARSGAPTTSCGGSAGRCRTFATWWPRTRAQRAAKPNQPGSSINPDSAHLAQDVCIGRLRFKGSSQHFLKRRRCCMVVTSRELRQRFWSLVSGGALREEAAVAVGLNSGTGRRWFSQAGGVIPVHVLKPLGRRYLSLAERAEIFAGVERGRAIRLLYKPLGRATSTVLRELARNMRHQAYRPRRRNGPAVSQAWVYRPRAAQQ